MRGVDLVRRILDQWEDNQKRVRRALERHIEDLEHNTSWTKAAFEGFDNSPVEDREAVTIVLMEWQGRQKLMDEAMERLEEERRRRQERLYNVLKEHIEDSQSKAETSLEED